MDTQPRPSREGQGKPQNERDEILPGLSSTYLPQDDTELPLPLTPTKEELYSSTVDDPVAQLNSDTSLNEEHRLCLAEMEGLRDKVDPPPLNQKLIIDFLLAIWHLVVLFLSPRPIQVWIVMSTALLWKSWIWLFIMMIIFLMTRHILVIATRRSHGATYGAWPSMVPKTVPHYILIVCGSGGHTGEMIRMVDRSIRPRNLRSHRRWAIGYGDRMSYDKVMEFEDSLVRKFGQQDSAGTFDIEFFHRPRAVHQSWLTTPFTALLSLVEMFKIMTTAPGRHTTTTSQYPGVIATDGPGAGFMFLLAAHWLKMIFVVPDSYVKTIFVESWARVKSLSMSGKLIKYLTLADVFIVQYEGIIRRLSSNEYYNSNFVAMPGRSNRASTRPA
ncbi:glycosyltransferase family 1 protein [Annulohypoxylon maeteangense]|uniref:glycosyltransferase family 1 protein n=1 Tax=Annulohypoxylon maeteangense TaxID=1927788 RepID=UPI002008BFB9|nr:glycosyltransferase family 1 protein [Annulohypoxylon maeteangense]KAI0884623.1 glycosyltransferase family 1 protein [Annulohypoxylon maeteangense]